MRENRSLAKQMQRSEKSLVPRYRPRLEGLEARWMPSVLTVTGTGNSGSATLRAAIAAAVSGDTIVFALPRPSTITLTTPLHIDKNLTVAGPGAQALTIDQTGAGQSVFNIGLTNQNAVVTISGVTIAGGTAASGSGLENLCSLTLNNCIVTNNNSTAAGGFGGGIVNHGAMIITNSQISNNSVIVSGGQAEAGGIMNDGRKLTLINTRVVNNIVSGSSGFSAIGAGIFNVGSLTLIDSTVSGNQVQGTSTDQQAGGVYDGGNLNMIASTVSGNSIGQGTGAGIEDLGSASVANSTIANNSGNGNGGGIACDLSASLTMENGTVAGNFDGGGSGGGIWIGSSASVTLENTIVAGNTTLALHISPDDVFGNPTAAFNNLIGNGSGTNITNGTNGNIVGVNPLLGPLQSNGGPTQTMALEPGSPAVDAGNDLYVIGTTDQRGLPRIVGFSVDIGAFESQARRIIVAAAGAGMAPEVKVYDAVTSAILLDFDAYDPHFLGGVRVAVGDVNGDGIPDIVTAPGPGGGPDIRVYDGATGVMLQEFDAYDPRFQAGVFVVAADVNGDGKADIITGPDEFSGPDVRVFFAGNVSGKPDLELLAYAAGFTGGVRVAAADLNGDGRADIITAPGPSGSPDIRIFSGTTLAKIGEFLAYAAQFTGGVFVAAGDVNGDKASDIITGAGAGGGPEVRAFDGRGAGAGNPMPAFLDDFYAYNSAFAGGVQVAAVALNSDATADIITGAGPGGGPHVRIFNGLTGQQLQQSAIDSFFPFDPSFSGGVFVGGQ